MRYNSLLNLKIRPGSICGNIVGKTAMFFALVVEAIKSIESKIKSTVAKAVNTPFMIFPIAGLTVSTFPFSHGSGSSNFSNWRFRPERYPSRFPSVIQRFLRPLPYFGSPLLMEIRMRIFSFRARGFQQGPCLRNSREKRGCEGASGQGRYSGNSSFDDGQNGQARIDCLYR